jgi:GNAT superfamily N-acetyltransferase
VQPDLTFEIVEVGLEGFDRVWPIIEAVLRPGDTYTLPADLDKETARRIWSEPRRRIFAAIDGETVLGTYYLRPNQGGAGDHVSNAGFMTADVARGRGVASAFCSHALETARAEGYGAMQFNAVVSVNESAVRLWLKHGFTRIGTVPQGFRHPTIGLVDLLILHRTL